MSIALWHLAKETARKVEALEKGMTPKESIDANLLNEVVESVTALEADLKLLKQQYVAMNARLSKALKKE